MTTRGATVRGPWPDEGVTFAVRRGRFTLPAGLRDRDPDAFAREFARALPETYDGTLNVTSHRDGKLEVYVWRIIRVVAA